MAQNKTSICRSATFGCYCLMRILIQQKYYWSIRSGTEARTNNCPKSSNLNQPCFHKRSAQ